MERMTARIPVETLHRRLHATRLYVLTGVEFLQGRPLLEVAEAALRGGAGALQLREKTLRDGELLSAARALRDLTRRFGALFLVNDRADVALLSDADGVHVGQRDLPPAEVRRLIGPDRLLGVSTHSLDQARRAVEAGADYVGVGPVYPTRTKADAVAPVTLTYVREVARARLPVPAFAIGGLKPDNLEAVLREGVLRVAVVTGVISADDPETAARRYREILDRYPLPETS